MRTLRRVIAHVAALGAVGSLVGLGCAVDTGSQPENGATQEESDSPETLTMSLDDGVAHATKVSPELVLVEIYDSAGRLGFVLECEVGREGGAQLRWVWLDVPASSGGESPPGSGSLDVPLEQLPELEDAIVGAVYLRGQIAGSMRGEEAYDNWGCDLPGWLGSGLTCSLKGACCDIHDACYARFHCSASSWINPFASAACKACNAAVVACITGPLYPGPSACCRLGNCGQPR